MRHTLIYNFVDALCELIRVFEDSMFKVDPHLLYELCHEQIVLIRQKAEEHEEVVRVQEISIVCMNCFRCIHFPPEELCWLG